MRDSNWARAGGEDVGRNLVKQEDGFERLTLGDANPVGWEGRCYVGLRWNDVEHEPKIAVGDA